ncbi:MAG TPA: tyrosine-type recombinase/integrase [Candidatus Polarisedimenticolaceae bacterium]|nr:tyrosine-type recombinase/integrase [Candidatus Polarisedimenticolaceae bacterium]
MKGTKLTKRTIDALRPALRDTFCWDSELPGFGLKVTPAGTRSYVFQYSKGRRKRRVTIGRHGAPWTPDAARKEAFQLKVEVAKGGDPAEVRQSERRALTVKELAERYIRDHAERKKKPNSVRDDKRLLERHIKPRLGNLKVMAVTRVDATRLHLELGPTPIQANRVLALLSKMMNLAEKWGIRADGTNPCRHVERFREKRRERFLSDTELARLGEALSVAEEEGLLTRDKPRGRRPLHAIPVSPFATAAIRMLLFTGCRLSEIVTLKWEHVDSTRNCLRLTESKTGPRIVPLGACAVQLLDGLPRVAGNPYVFPGRSMEPSHFVGLPHVWHRIRRHAGMVDVRLHDLRHTFASVAAIGGSSLLVIGALLGHKQATTTARYAHLGDHPHQTAAESVSARIAAALTATGKQVVIVPLRPLAANRAVRTMPEVETQATPEALLSVGARQI